MHIEYVGHKPLISHTGVDVSIGKEDKYTYIEAAAQMLHYLEEYRFEVMPLVESHEFSKEAKILELLHRHRPDFDNFYAEKIKEYKNKLDEEVVEARLRENIDDIEKEVLVKNLNIMRDYRLQRVTNKLVYEELINACVDLIRLKNIKELIMPYSLNFTHVSVSLETTLALLDYSVTPKTEITIDEDAPHTHFIITTPQSTWVPNLRS